MNTNNRKIFATLAFLWMGHFLVDFMIGIWPVYKTMAGLDLAKAGLVSAVCAFLGEGLQIYFGPLSDKGWRQFLVIGGLIAAAASTLMAYTESYFLLFLMFLMTSVGSGAFHPSAVGLLGKLAGDRKGLFITIFASGGALGLATSQLIFSETYEFFDGHMTWLAVPVVLLVACIFCYGLATGNSGQTSHTKRRSFRSFFQLFKHRELRLVYISQLCNQTIFWAAIFLLPDVLSSRGYESWISFGGGHLFLILGGASMMIPGGYLSDKYSFKTVILIASVLGMASFYTFIFIPDLTDTVLCGLLFFMGAMIGLVNPVQVALGNRLMPKDTGTVSAFLMGMVLCVSEGLGQAGGGFLTRFFETDAPASALGVVGVAFVVGIMAAMQLPAQVTEEHQFEIVVA